MPIINDATVNLIKSFEGLSLKAYHGSADRPGVFTIGYGCIKYPPFFKDGSAVALNDLHITETQALSFLKYEIEQKAELIDALLRDDLNQNQFGALLSFAFNLGEGALKGSHLRIKVNAKPTDHSIRDEFMKWAVSNGLHVPGLARRRAAEADLYFT